MPAAPAPRGTSSGSGVHSRIVHQQSSMSVEPVPQAVPQPL
jgi:hypothetical protein